MSKVQDYVPRGNEAFNVWSRFLIQYVTAKCTGTKTAAPQWKHIPAEALATLNTAYTAWSMFNRMKRAWAVWMLANASYGCKLDGCFGFDRVGTSSKKLKNKRTRFSIDYAARLQEVQIECCDALRIIKSRDTAETFFYLDPPYVGTDMGHYDGYSQEDFDGLLRLLESVQGQFLLSSFRDKSLAEYTRRNKWETLEIKLACSMTSRLKTPQEKVEVLTANYPLSVELFGKSTG